MNKYSGLNFIYGKESYLDHRGHQKSKEVDEMDFHVIEENRKGRSAVSNFFVVYRCCDDLTFDYEYYLLANKSKEGGLLIPEAANFDYFLIIKHYIDEDDFSKLLASIRKVKEVLLIKEIDPMILKSKENLIF